MPQIVMYIKSTADEVMDALASAAKKEGFAIDEEKDTRMTVRKGSVALALFAGWFVDYVVADAKVAEQDDDEVKLTIQWTNAWWRGWLANMKNPGVMRALANRVERVVEDAGGEVLERKDK